jgi:hypothetical protein
LLLLKLYEALAAHWPGKLLAGNTIAACFKPAVLLMWELMQTGGMVFKYNSSSSSSNADFEASCSSAAALWIKNLAIRLSKEEGLAGLQQLPGLPQQSIELLAAPVVYKVLAVGLGE